MRRALRDISRLNKLELDPARVEELIVTHDEDGSGRMEYPEFLALCRALEPRAPPHVQAAFHRHDVDRSGYLSYHEVRQALASISETSGVELDAERVEQLLLQCDLSPYLPSCGRSARPRAATLLGPCRHPLHPSPRPPSPCPHRLYPSLRALPRYDEDGSGRVEYPEFIDLCRALEPPPPAAPAAAEDAAEGEGEAEAEEEPMEEAYKPPLFARFSTADSAHGAEGESTDTMEGMPAG